MSTHSSANPSSLDTDVRHLAAMLACAVTMNSNQESDWIAKNGQESLFSVIRKIVPEVNASGKHGTAQQKRKV